MDARDMLVKNNTEIARFVKTEQYRLSRELMKTRYFLSMDDEEMATKLGVSFKYYIDLECGDEEVTIEEYEELIKRASK